MRQSRIMMRQRRMMRRQQFNVNVAHPVGPSLALPVHLNIEIMQTISVQFDYPADVAFVNLRVEIKRLWLSALFGVVVTEFTYLFVSTATANGQPHPKSLAHIKSILIIA